MEFRVCGALGFGRLGFGFRRFVDNKGHLGSFRTGRNLGRGSVSGKWARVGVGSEGRDAVVAGSGFMSLLVKVRWTATVAQVGACARLRVALWLQDIVGVEGD
jgi:hypothetical protein